ncbi:ABC transporter ATP-binding protein [Aureimonas sp. D3]|uniref:ABC transporter ATP-binding protein n=1 Tax=Aureimonas sp. D3 TaxID=1638164 RepID=UPI00078255F9|nr:sn-glycerol-3-phosphate ABC transporter ATP-binding protein UgpC [Aureimonas sp. D3]
MATLHLRNVKKSFAAVDVIKGVNLDIADREFVVFVGPSGCGKSTLLRMIAGLEEITEGDLDIDGKRANDIPPDERGLAMVFQTYALYPHMSVRENMAFALKLAKVPKAEQDRKVQDVARLLQLEPYLDRKPKALSGGQRQRVAIGRAMVREPKVFLFDEPLSNLDAALRVQMRIELSRLHERLNATMIYVTHDQVEAMTLADKIVVLRDGRIEQVGTPLELYHHPVNRFVAGFIGSPKMNFLDCEVVSTGPEGVTVRLLSGAMLQVPVFGEGARPGEKLQLGIRPEHLSPGGQAMLPGEIVVIERLGGQTYLYIQAGNGDLIIAEAGGDSTARLHETVQLSFDPNAAHLFDGNGHALPRLHRHALAGSIPKAVR